MEQLMIDVVQKLVLPKDKLWYAYDNEATLLENISLNLNKLYDTTKELRDKLGDQYPFLLQNLDECCERLELEYFKMYVDYVRNIISQVEHQPYDTWKLILSLESELKNKKDPRFDRYTRYIADISQNYIPEICAGCGNEIFGCHLCDFCNTMLDENTCKLEEFMEEQYAQAREMFHDYDSDLIYYDIDVYLPVKQKSKPTRRQNQGKNINKSRKDDVSMLFRHFLSKQNGKEKRAKKAKANV